MSLYLCVFAADDADDEIASVEVGHYSDFARFRTDVATALESGVEGSRFPVLMTHSDSDGQWTVAELDDVLRELLVIRAEFRKLTPVPFPAGWQSEAAAKERLEVTSRAHCYIDVGGRPLLDQLIDLATFAKSQGLPIWFQ